MAYAAGYEAGKISQVSLSGSDQPRNPPMQTLQLQRQERGGEKKKKELQEVREVDSVDKTITIICDWVQKELKSDDLTADNKRDVAEMTKALAELVSARASVSGNVLVEADEIAMQIADKLEKSLNCLNL